MQRPCSLLHRKATGVDPCLEYRLALVLDPTDGADWVSGAVASGVGGWLRGWLASP